MIRKEPRQSRPDWVWLVVGCACLLFMGGKWNIVIVTWIGSVFFLRYYRTRSGAAGILLSVPLLLAASYVFFLGLAVQVTLGFQVLISVCYTLYILVPCLVDRLLLGRIPNRTVSSLVYPAALVVVQFLLSYVEQLGTVLTWTGSMFSQKPLIQMVAITGVWGPSFLVGWFASIVNAIWEEGLDVRRLRVPVLSFCAVFVLAMAWGGAHMAFQAPGPGTVKAGSVIVDLPQDNYFWTYLDMPAGQQLALKEQYRGAAREVEDGLFRASEGIIPSGIRLLAWGSGNAVVFAEDEPRLTRRLQDFARAHGVYFFPCLLVLGDYAGPDRTKVLAIEPDGRIAYTHYKGRNPNPGYFHGMSLETLDTPYGRIASPICYEMESHRLIRQAGAQGVDILIVPGDEPSRQNAVVHTELSMFRGIENGCSVLRTTLEGFTLGIDSQGRVLSQMNYYQTTGNRTILTELPVHGTRTFYAAVGDWLPWACAALLAVLAVWSVLATVRPARRGARRELLGLKFPLRTATFCARRTVMRKTILAVIVAVAVAAALPAQNVDLKVFQDTFQSFATTIAGTLSSTATIGMNWSPAYIGQFPHFGLGVTAGASLVPLKAIEPIISMFGVTGLPPELQTYGAPVPAATIDARIGGFFLPFDIGLKFGTIPDSLKSALGSFQVDYLMAGFDVRYALLKDQLLVPALSVGVGYTYFKGSIGVPKVIPGASIDLTPYMNLAGYPGTHTLSFSDADLLFNWQSSVIEAKVQLSKQILFLFTPHIGFSAAYGISSAGGGVSSTVTYTGSATTAQMQSALQTAGLPVPTDQALTVSSSASGWALRAFGGLNIALLFLNLDTSVFYNVLTGSYGGAVNVRVQL